MNIKPKKIRTLIAKRLLFRRKIKRRKKVLSTEKQLPNDFRLSCIVIQNSIRKEMGSGCGLVRSDRHETKKQPSWQLISNLKGFQSFSSRKQREHDGISD